MRIARVIPDNLLRIIACIGTASLAALTVAMFVCVLIGPRLMPDEFITDTGPNIYSRYLWGSTAIAWLAVLIFSLRISKSGS